MIVVKNYDQFQNELLPRVVHERDLFGFFLFDPGPSQPAVANFADENRDWLDQLAKSADMYFFVPLKTKAKDYENASLQVARMFGIRPNQLPGIILFTLSLSAGDSTASPALGVPAQPDGNSVYLPIDTELFDAGPSQVEGLLRDLFALIQTCQADSSSPDELMEQLQKQVTWMRRERDMRPVARYLTDAVRSAWAVSVPILIAFVQTILNEKGSQMLIAGIR